ncbi:MAG: PD40 domain-containing protein [Lentisphaeria bacterium]|nr:PD40 domain-containing protein [Lentisphaeria bacterium]
MRFLYSAIFILFLTVTASAQVIVSGQGKTDNPTLVFRGVPGDSNLTKFVQSDLINCGWFKVMRNGKSDYIVNGRLYGQTLVLDVTNGAGAPLYTVRAVGTEPRKLAQTAVDALLKKEFGVEGICRTKIVFSAETRPRQREIYVCDYDGGNIRRLTSNATLSIEPSWHPDGKSIIYNQYLISSTPLVQYDLTQNKSRALSKNRGINSGRISPDGKKLALILTDGNQQDLYVRDLNGGNLTRLTNDRAVEASPTWSPDSRYICFVSDRSGRPKLYIIPAGGGAARRVEGTLGSEAVNPDWSADNKIVYSAKLGDYVVKVVDLSQTMGFPPPKNRENSIIADSSFPVMPGESPSWAPDNRHVVVSCRGSIYVVDTRTNARRKLIGGKSYCTGARWSKILF